MVSNFQNIAQQLNLSMCRSSFDYLLGLLVLEQFLLQYMYVSNKQYCMHEVENMCFFAKNKD